MPDTKHYTGLSIENKRYHGIRREFDSAIKGQTSLTFTNWCITVIEAAIQRQKFLQKAFPKLRLIRADKDGIIIDDLERNIVVKVFYSDGLMDCNVQEGKERYILYATMSPNMIL